jgi:hypothetical protein
MQHFAMPEWEMWVAASVLAILLGSVISGVIIAFWRQPFGKLDSARVGPLDSIVSINQMRARLGLPLMVEPVVERDPLNLPPSRVQDILFADGFRMTANEIYKRGLLPVVDSDGRVVMVIDPDRKTNTAVEEWCGLRHGARIT